MAKNIKQASIPDEIIMDKIYFIRGQKSMLDCDFAELYGVETKRLKEAVRRNISRFPEDFMFEMTKEEFENWRTQFASSKEEFMGLRYAPFCFSEQGVTMLSCVLNSERAIAVNIQIIRIFYRMREMISTHKDILLSWSNLRIKIVAMAKI
jgi:ORF6N domain